MALRQVCYITLLLAALLVCQMSAVPVNELKESNPADSRENLDTAETLFGWGGPWGGPWGPGPFGPYGGIGGFYG